MEQLKYMKKLISLEIFNSFILELPKLDNLIYINL